MRRREFLAILGGAVTVGSLPARAQHAGMPVVCFVSPGSSQNSATRVAAFKQGLASAGYTEGRNVVIEYHWGEGQYSRLQKLIVDLVRRPVAVIVAISTDTALAAKAATSTIPIIFSSGTDPVKIGLVASYNRPGGNVTGVSFLVDVLVAKQFEVVHELVPNASRVGLLVNPGNSNTEQHIRDVQTAAKALGKSLIVNKVSSPAEFDATFTDFSQRRIGSLLITSDPIFNGQPAKLVAFATRHALPTVSALRDFAVAGALASYGTSITDAIRLVGEYTGRVLNGEKPASLPIQQSTKVELIVNLKTAKELGLTVPQTLLARADEVIE
jgi:putative ABC transport system substrate-binding protein